MRAFFGLEVPEASRRILSGVRAAAEAGSSGLPRLRWTPAENLHLTVRFLGNVDQTVADDLLKGLRRSLPSFGPLVLRVEEISWFPRRRPTVLAAHIARSDRLLQLFETVEAEAVAGGLAPESRAPNPHVTLARFKGRARRSPDPLEITLDAEFECRALTLFESRLGAKGATYSHYGEIPLDGVSETSQS